MVAYCNACNKPASASNNALYYCRQTCLRAITSICQPHYVTAWPRQHGLALQQASANRLSYREPTQHYTMVSATTSAVALMQRHTCQCSNDMQPHTAFIHQLQLWRRQHDAACGIAAPQAFASRYIQGQKQDRLSCSSSSSPCAEMTCVLKAICTQHTVCHARHSYGHHR